MIDNRRVRLTAYVVSGAWSAVLALNGIHLHAGWSKTLSFLPLVVVAVFGAFDNYLWQLKPMRTLFHRPQLNGTWHGELVSIRANAEGAVVEHAPIPIFLVIHQSFLSLDIGIITAESKSHSIGTLLLFRPPSGFCIYYHYENEPHIRVRSQSPRHAGGSKIEVSGIEPIRLEGEYWTDRETRGSFDVTKLTKTKYGSWSEAQAALAEKKG